MHRSSFLLVVLCLHCGGQTQTGPAEEAPTTPASTEATEAPAADTDTPAADKDAPATPPEKAETAAPAGTAAPAETKLVCAKLPKVDCKVRKGCAWNDKLKCVEEGGGM